MVHSLAAKAEQALENMGNEMLRREPGNEMLRRACEFEMAARKLRRAVGRMVERERRVNDTDWVTFFGLRLGESPSPTPSV